MGAFYYWANEGNLGDLLIAEATRQFFRRENLDWRPYCPANPPREDSYCLVYGGGGRFTSHWGGLEPFQNALTAPQVQKCIILPHSFYEADDFLQGLDNRHTVFCRGLRSYLYVKSAVAPQVCVELADDMALALCLEDLDRTGVSFKDYEHEQDELAHLLKQGVGRIMKRKVWLATVRHKLKGRRRKIAFLLRTDAEKRISHSSPLAYDISLVWNSSCAGNTYTPGLIHLFAAALRHPDIVVTDRLHVGILSLLCGKKVYLIDNNYGKLGEVCHLSLQNRFPVQLVTTPELPAELHPAFRQLNTGLFSRLFLPLRRQLRQLRKHV